MASLPVEPAAFPTPSRPERPRRLARSASTPQVDLSMWDDEDDAPWLPVGAGAGAPARAAKLARHMSFVLPPSFHALQPGPPAHGFAAAQSSPFVGGVAGGSGSPFVGGVLGGSGSPFASALAPPTPDQTAQLGFLTAAAQRESERQLSLLHQLKARIAAAAHPAASSCGSLDSPPRGPCGEAVEQPALQRLGAHSNHALLHSHACMCSPPSAIDVSPSLAPPLLPAPPLHPPAASQDGLSASARGGACPGAPAPVALSPCLPAAPSLLESEGLALTQLHLDHCDSYNPLREGDLLELQGMESLLAGPAAPRPHPDAAE